MKQNEIVKDKMKYIQSKIFIDLCSTLDGPVILCGDMNDTPNSRAFHVINKNYINTYSAKGWGLSDTFGEYKINNKLKHIPFIKYLSHDFIRIDHIFVSKQIKIKSANVITAAKGSDHKPIVSVIELK